MGRGGDGKQSVGIFFLSPCPSLPLSAFVCLLFIFFISSNRANQLTNEDSLVCVFLCVCEGVGGDRNDGGTTTMTIDRTPFFLRFSQQGVSLLQEGVPQRHTLNPGQSMSFGFLVDQVMPCHVTQCGIKGY